MLLTRICRVSHHPHVKRIFVPKIAQVPKEITKEQTKDRNQKEIYPSCHIIPMLKGISPRDSFSCRRDISRLERFLRKEMRILRLHLILPFPRIIWSPVRVPPNLNDTNLAVT